MGADSFSPVGVTALNTKFHAAIDIFGLPILLAISFYCFKGTSECIIWIRRSLPDMTFIQMGMHIHETRPYLPFAPINHLGIASRRISCRYNLRDHPLRYFNID